MDPIRIALVGLGKIARDQHLPAIAGNTAFSLAATVSPHDAGLAGVPHHKSFENLLAHGPAVDAVAEYRKITEEILRTLPDERLCS